MVVKHHTQNIYFLLSLLLFWKTQKKQLKASALIYELIISNKNAICNQQLISETAKMLSAASNV